MLDLTGTFGISSEQIDQIIENEVKHPEYDKTVRRAKIMNSWYKAEDDTQNPSPKSAMGDLTAQDGQSVKSDIIKRSHRESLDDYEEKLARMKLFPFERKFFSAQQRIYDENNVQRQFPKPSEDFWRWKQDNYDDNGDSANIYYKDKVLFVKDVLGFGASMTDIMMADNGQPVRDPEGNPVPYTYTIRPHELFNYQIKQGVLTFLITRQKERTFDDSTLIKWRAFTRDGVRIWRQRDDEDKEFVKRIRNPFGRIPATILRGDIDQDSGFRTGKPLRYSLTGLYLAASELFYDLQDGAFLFGHPIPFLPVSIAKNMAGAFDQDTDEIDRDTIKDEVGMVGLYPDNYDMPNQLFFQADMSGLEFLKETIFGNLVGLIFLLASVRDKSKMAHNISGRAKEFDHIDEQGLLAQTAREMETIERKDFELMAKVRNENFDDFTINYTKHHDLSSASEIFADLIEAAQYDVKDQSLWVYWISEYLRKRSAPADIQSEATEQAEMIGRPLTPEEFDRVGNVMGEVERVVKMRPELFKPQTRQALLENIKDIKAEFETSSNGSLNTNDNGAE